jgi:hypothetical protein
MERSRALRRHAFATLLWVAAAALVPAHLGLTICRFAGLIHFDAAGSCCGGDSADPPAQPAVDVQRCCSLRTVHLTSAPVERHTAGPLAALPPARLDQRSPAPPRPAPAPRRVRSFDVGPPILLAKQSFLI